jgi:multidrug efflux system membrane fusion protein
MLDRDQSMIVWSEIRKSKSGIRNKPKIQNPNDPDGASARPRFGFWISVLRACFGFRNSDFGFDLLLRFSNFGLVALVGSLVLFGGCPKEPAAKQGPRPEGGPAVPVTTALVEQKTTAIVVPSFGTVEACADVDIKAQVTGILMQVHFTEGQMVSKGDRLLSIDPRQPQAALKMAQANLEKDQAQLKNAEREAARQQELLAKGFASQDVYDQTVTAVETLRAAVSADKAAIENAALLCDYCSICSPVDGFTGRLDVHQGNLVKANDSSVVTIRQVDPIYVSFWVREQYLPAIQKHMAAGGLDVQVTPPGQDSEPTHGTLSFIDNTVDPANRTIHLRATFANKDRRLWPGQYVNVVLTVAQEPNSIVVPSPAIQPGQNQQFIYVVKSDQTVEARPVTVKRAVNDKESVVEGVQPGEVVVTNGQLRLVPGARVQSKDAAAREAPRAGSGKGEVTKP